MNVLEVSMAKEICTVCSREIDSRGMSGHMKTHKADEGDGNDDGVISYPSNEQKIEETNTVVDLDESQGKSVKKQVKKRVASKPASSSTSKPDADGHTEDYHKSREWQGLFRD